ncbi:MAG: HAD hydrolase family protein [Anaeroplasmataceae bacterium]|nr:HAD hydrolase family protein [Anaeroplasmataceae bacterium]
MKRIGLRTIKTAISVFGCLLFFILLKLFEFIPGVPDNFAYSWYNPFFAGIATAFSVHASKSASLNQAKIRCVASLIGGIIGILLITFYELCGGKWPNLASVNLETFNFVLPYLLISFCTIIVIIVGVALKQQQAVFVSILTFLSVTVNPNVNVGQWQWQFGTNRILSTMIGVLIALGVNLFRFPHRFKNKNLLFCVCIDGMLLKEEDRFKGFMQYKMNYLHRIHANVTLFTTRTPTTFMPLLEDVKVEHPIICMSGAALYDPKTCTYLFTEKISIEASERVKEILKEAHISPFINLIRNNVLFTYNESLDNEGEEIYAESKRNAGYCCYISQSAPKEEVLYFLIVEKEEVVNPVLETIRKDKLLSEQLSILIYDVFETNQAKDLKYIKIYSKKIEDLSSIKKYALENQYDIVGLTSSTLSNHLLKNAKYAITIDTNEEDIKSQCKKIIDHNNPNDLFREVNKIYHYNLAKYGKNKT